MSASGWEATTTPAASQTSSEQLRERYIERTLEKIHRHLRHPRTRPMDVLLVVLLLACLGMLAFRPVRGTAATDNSAALKDVRDHLDRLSTQQATLEKQLAAVQRSLSHTTPAPPVAVVPPTVVTHPTAAPPPSLVAPPPVVTATAAKPDGPARVHLLQAGESLWSVCEKYYGDAALLNALAHYNGIDDPAAMHVGMTIKIPPMTELQAWHPSKPTGKK